MSERRSASERAAVAEPRVLTVSQLTERIRDTLQGRFADVWVAGEICDLAQPQSGHVYLGLKDNGAQIRAVIWRSAARRLPFQLHDGLEVICHGYVDVYPPRGSYQLIIDQVQPKGVGALQLALLQLRNRLAEEGLFDARHKKPLPRFPRRIAVITSPTGAAIRDFLEVVTRRWPAVSVLIIPTRVQGAEAVPEIVSAIQLAHRLRPRPDCLVVTRGGGSLEDLWCFNDEQVVRAVFASRIPVVSAVGHEIDVTLTDLVADVRALTPSEAGQRVVPAAEEVRSQLQHMARRARNAVTSRWERCRLKLDALAQCRSFRRPLDRLLDARRTLDDWQLRLARTVAAQMGLRRERLAAMAGRLESLSPLNVLARGYSVTQRQRDRALVLSATDTAPGELITTRLHSGSLVSRVEQVCPADRIMELPYSDLLRGE